MDLTESDARKRSVSELKRVLNRSGLASKSEVKRMTYHELWFSIQGVVRGDGAPRPPPMSDPFEVKNLLSGGLLNTLLTLLIDFSSLHSASNWRMISVRPNNGRHSCTTDVSERFGRNLCGARPFLRSAH